MDVIDVGYYRFIVTEVYINQQKHKSIFGLPVEDNRNCDVCAIILGKQYFNLKRKGLKFDPVINGKLGLADLTRVKLPWLFLSSFVCA